MSLKVGDKAPAFELSSKQADGIKKIKLSDNLGKKNTLLLFVPMAFTGVCTKEFCEISAGLGQYTSLNADVLGISVHTAETHRTNIMRKLRLRSMSELVRYAIREHIIEP